MKKNSINFIETGPVLKKAMENMKEKSERDFKFHEIAPKEFIMRRDQLPLSLQSFLTSHNEDSYLEMKTNFFLSNDKRSGFGLNPDGQLLSVFSLEKECGQMLVKKAISEGAEYLSCMGEKLRELYDDGGFEVTKEETWNKDYAPEHWDYDRFGTPNYYEMKIKDERKRE